MKQKQAVMYLEPFSLPETGEGSKTLVLIQEITRFDFAVVYNRAEEKPCP